MSNKAETFSPSALLKVIITDKGVGTLDFCEVGEIKLKHSNGMVTSMFWNTNDEAAIYRDKNGYLNVEWYLKDFSKNHFEANNPITRPNWSYLVTGDILDMQIEISHQGDGAYEPNPIEMKDIKIRDFYILVKEEDGSIAKYPFLEEQLYKFMEEGIHNAPTDL